MMSDYIESVIIPTAHGRGGSFNCKMDVALDNFPTFFSNIPVKIDTGCSVSTIFMRRLNVSERICKQKKQDDIDAGIPHLLSYGVETGGRYHPKPRTKSQKMKSEAMKFCHKVFDFSLGGVPIPIEDIYLNYNRTGNILIGMDILERFISFMDVSRITGQYTWIACLREQDDKEAFYQALQSHFGLSVKI